jgi:hypothetical protein
MDEDERRWEEDAAELMAEDGPDWDRALALGQGVFYVVTGIWPIVSLRTFELMTGPKADGWLVKTAGVLITAIGAGLTTAGLRGRVTPEMKLFAVGAATGLTMIDLVYVARRRIARVYLLDAVAEVGLIGAWSAAQLLGRRRRGRA